MWEKIRTLLGLVSWFRADVKTIVMVLDLAIMAFKLLKGEIEQAIFNAHIDSINEAVAKAKQGKLEDRLKGGSDVEDNFNRHAPKP